MSKRLFRGFTLIELLVVIGILGILLAIVLIAINPAAQFAQANNTKRQSDVSAILNAVHQFAADSRGNLPADIDGTATEISEAGANICADISPDYIALLPRDPSLTGDDTTDCATGYTTGYSISVDADGRVTVVALSAEAVRGVTPTISLTR